GVWTLSFAQAVFPANPFIIQPAIVAHPADVDGIVFARFVAINFFFAGADDDVAAGGATGADAFGFFEKPNPHLETEIFRGEGADGANIDGVKGIIIVERLSRVAGEGVKAAPIHDAQGIVANDVFGEADAAGAEDAAFVIEHDSGAEVHAFGFMDFGLDKAARGFAVIHGVLLQFALACLVADRAVQGMIDEQELEHALAHLLYGGGI